MSWNLGAYTSWNPLGHTGPVRDSFTILVVAAAVVVVVVVVVEEEEEVVVVVVVCWIYPRYS